MVELIFPSFNYQLSSDAGKVSIFDMIRKKKIVLTPEEWVRQHLIHFLIDHLGYPKSLIAVEDGLQVNKMRKRSDVVVYTRQGGIFMVVECKSYKIQLQQAAMDQLSAYNQRYQSKYLAITNGLSVMICEMNYELKNWVMIHDFPAYK
jgi:hypothetical protein